MHIFHCTVKFLYVLDIILLIIGSSSDENSDALVPASISLFYKKTSPPLFRRSCRKQEASIRTSVYSSRFTRERNDDLLAENRRYGRGLRQATKRVSASRERTNGPSTASQPLLLNVGRQKRRKPHGGVHVNARRERLRPRCIHSRHYYVFRDYRNCVDKRFSMHSAR